MSSQSDSSSGKRRRLSTSSPNKSTSSSDTGDVLIRSTGLKPGSESVRITVEKVRGRPAQPPVTEQQRLKPCQQPEMVRPLRSAVFSQPGKSSGRWTRFTQSCGYQTHYYWYFCVCVFRPADAAEETCTDQKEQSESSSFFIGSGKGPSSTTRARARVCVSVRARVRAFAAPYDSCPCWFSSGSLQKPPAQTGSSVLGQAAYSSLVR